MLAELAAAGLVAEELGDRRYERVVVVHLDGAAGAAVREQIADAADRGRNRVGLEVDADSPTGAHGLYLSMGWKTSYVTESWHRDVPVT